VATPQQEELKRRVREANDIVEVIGAVAKLTRAGKKWKGLCPFPDHSDTAPSFYVDPDWQTLRCFGCGRKGDVFGFVMEYDRVDFKEAMTMLAERRGIPLVYSREDAEKADVTRRRKSLLWEAQRKAAEYFVDRLRSPEGAPAREYLAGRGLADLADEWMIGYAPDRWDGLTGQFGTTEKRQRLLVAAGLARERETGGVYDAFRNRVMFPITDTQGRLVGFGGRILGEGEPKYLNTSETPVFAKGRLLYGLDRARDEISRSGRAILVEGYTDVLRCHQHGFKTAVATLGTALGAEHLRLLRRFGAKKVMLVYDADAAGVKAAERGLELMLSEELGGAVVSLGGDADPCDFLAEKGREAFAAALDAAVDLFEFKIGRVLEGRNRTDLQEMAEAAARLVETASYARDPVRRALLRKRISETVGVPETALVFREPPRQTGTGGETPGGEAPPDIHAVPAGEPGRIARAERELAALLVRCPGGVEIAREVVDLAGLADPLAREVVGAIGGLYDESVAAGREFDGKGLLDRLTVEAVSFAADARLSAHQAGSGEGEGDEPEDMRERVRKSAVALWRMHIPAALEGLAGRIAAAEAAGDVEAAGELRRERMELKRKRDLRQAEHDPDNLRRRRALRARAPRRPPGGGAGPG